MSDLQRSILLNSEMIAIHQDDMRLSGRRMGYDDTNCKDVVPGISCQIWAKPLINQEFAIALYNAGTMTHDITVSWETINPEWMGATVSLRNVWAHSDLGSFTGSYTAQAVPSHGTVVVRASLISN